MPTAFLACLPMEVLLRIAPKGHVLTLAAASQGLRAALGAGEWTLDLVLNDDGKRHAPECSGGDAHEQWKRQFFGPALVCGDRGCPACLVRGLLARFPRAALRVTGDCLALWAGLAVALAETGRRLQTMEWVPRGTSVVGEHEESVLRGAALASLFHGGLAAVRVGGYMNYVSAKAIAEAFSTHQAAMATSLGALAITDVNRSFRHRGQSTALVMAVFSIATRANFRALTSITIANIESSLVQSIDTHLADVIRANTGHLRELKLNVDLDDDLSDAVFVAMRACIGLRVLWLECAGSLRGNHWRTRFSILRDMRCLESLRLHVADYPQMLDFAERPHVLRTVREFRCGITPPSPHTVRCLSAVQNFQVLHLYFSELSLPRLTSLLQTLFVTAPGVTVVKMSSGLRVFEDGLMRAGWATATRAWLYMLTDVLSRPTCRLRTLSFKGLGICVRETEHNMFVAMFAAAEKCASLEELDMRGLGFSLVDRAKFAADVAPRVYRGCDIMRLSRCATYAETRAYLPLCTFHRAGGVLVPPAWFVETHA